VTNEEIQENPNPIPEEIQENTNPITEEIKEIKEIKE
jgi:hypothetical protein